MRSGIVEALESGALLLTPNRRLARRVAIDYGEAQAAAGRVAWESPRILPWDDWLERLWVDVVAHWTAAVPPPELLTRLQALELWRQCIEGDDELDPLIPLASLAAGADEAWRLLHAYGGKLARVMQAPLARTPSGFKIWAERYLRRCEEARWIDAARLPDIIGRRLAEAAPALPQSALLYAFAEVNPQRAQLLEAFAAAGMHWERVTPQPRAGTALRFAAESARGEIESAAQWARSLRQSSPEARIGIVVPDLAERRHEVTRVLREVLAPASLLAADEGPGLGFELSLGTPLADEARVATALRLLRWPGAALALEELSWLLRAPSLGGYAAESWGRSELARRFTELGWREMRLAQLARHELTRQLAPQLAQLLESGLAVSDRAAPRATASAWRQQWEKELAALGWPGDAPMSSHAYQIIEAWERLLAHWVRLDLIAAPLRRAEALDSLARAARDAVFQPEGRDARITVLGVLEASGQRFDALWVTGMSAAAWPGPARPQPFLPLEWQRQRGLPHATAERELAFARETLGDFRQAAPRVVFSWPRHDGEAPVLSSALLEDLPEVLASELPLDQEEPLTTRLARAMATTPRRSDAGLPAKAPELMTAASFEAQADCPFQAYARGRLKLAAWPKIDEGVSALEHGKMLHLLLESLALAWPSSAALANLSEAEEEQRIDSAVERAMGELREERWQALPEAVRLAEGRRLKRLAQSWLAFERRRPAFQLDLHEHKLTLALGGMNCALRIDRVDHDPAGREIIIDYKSGGLPTRLDWFLERIAKPQLPLYAVARSEHEVAAVVAVGVAAEGVRCMGYGVEEGLFPEVRETRELTTPAGAKGWPAVLAYWRRALEGLAEEYRGGEARVAPRDTAQTCVYCEFATLCRIAEGSLAGGAEEGEDDDVDRD